MTERVPEGMRREIGPDGRVYWMNLQADPDGTAPVAYSTAEPQCDDCRHYWGAFRCAAFPDGIPPDIIINRVSHRRAWPGTPSHPTDNGIRFEANED